MLYIGPNRNNMGNYWDLQRIAKEIKTTLGFSAEKEKKKQLYFRLPPQQKTLLP